jgi:hypothetical protein
VPVVAGVTGPTEMKLAHFTVKNGTFLRSSGGSSASSYAKTHFSASVYGQFVQLRGDSSGG